MNRDLTRHANTFSSQQELGLGTGKAKGTPPRLPVLGGLESSSLEHQNVLVMSGEVSDSSSACCAGGRKRIRCVNAKGYKLHDVRNTYAIRAGASHSPTRGEATSITP